MSSVPHLTCDRRVHTSFLKLMTNLGLDWTALSWINAGIGWTKPDWLNQLGNWHETRLNGIFPAKLVS